LSKRRGIALLTPFPMTVNAMIPGSTNAR